MNKESIIKNARLRYFDRIIEILNKEKGQICANRIAEKIEGWFLYKLELYEYYTKVNIGDDNLELLEYYLKTEIEKLIYRDLKEIYTENEGNKKFIRYKERKKVGRINYLLLANELEELKNAFNKIKKHRPKNHLQALEQIKNILPEYEWDEYLALNIITASSSDTAYEILSNKYNRTEKYLKRVIGRINKELGQLKRALLQLDA